MNVKKITMQNFLRHKETSVKFPDTGLVVITGRNGEGKSTLLDAVYAGISGDSLRGGDMIRKGESKASVQLETDKFNSTLVLSKRTSFSWQKVGEPPVQYETTTKAFRALESVVDPKMWVRTHVFGSTTESFCSASDSERKKFLERLVGLDVYANAYAAVSKDASTVARKLAEAKMSVDLLTERLDNLYNQVSQLSELSATSPVRPSTDVQKDIASAEQRIAVLKSKQREVQTALAEYNKQVSEINFQLRNAADAKRLAHSSMCPTCSRPTTHDMREEADAEFERLTASLLAKKAEQPEPFDNSALVHEEQLLGEMRTEFRLAREAENSAQNIARRVDAVNESIDRATTDLGDACDSFETLSSQYDVLKQAADVLSTKGYRAHLLGNTLSAITSKANEILWQLALGNITVEMTPYGETKKGDATTNIRFSIFVDGEELDFKCLSGGQKRRVEVALVLGAASLIEDGTLFFDEAFDALDEEGVERLCEVLDSLAASRCVVVITHNQELATKMRSKLRLSAVKNTYVLI